MDYIINLFHNECEYHDDDFILISGDEDFIQYYNDKKLIIDCHTPMSKKLIILITDIDPVVLDDLVTLRIVFINTGTGILVNYYKLIENQMYYIKSCFRHKLNLVDTYSDIRDNKYSFGTQIAIKFCL